MGGLLAGAYKTAPRRISHRVSTSSTSDRRPEVVFPCARQHSRVFVTPYSVTILRRPGVRGRRRPMSASRGTIERPPPPNHHSPLRRDHSTRWKSQNNRRPSSFFVLARCFASSPARPTDKQTTGRESLAPPRRAPIRATTTLGIVLFSLEPHRNVCAAETAWSCTPLAAVPLDWYCCWRSAAGPRSLAVRVLLFTLVIVKVVIHSVAPPHSHHSPPLFTSIVSLLHCTERCAFLLLSFVQRCRIA